MENPNRDFPEKVDEKFGDYVHVFQVSDKSIMEGDKRTWKQKFWQLFPSCCASLIAVPFGIMMGWPSANYPYLLEPTSEIPITWSQSAMIAGFFMIGITFVTPFSLKYHLGPKYGIWIGMVIMTIGWILMWYAQDIFWLLGSRFTVGFGGGYGMGQVRCFISDMCEPKLAVTLAQQLNFYVNFGVIIASANSIFFEFRNFSFVSVIISCILIFVVVLLPITPKEFIKRNEIDKAVMLLNFLRGKKDHTAEIEKMKNELQETSSPFFIPILKSKKLRYKFIKLNLLVFLQQFSGGPTTIVYCQLIFKKSGCPYPEYCAVLYAVIYFTSNIYGVFYSSNFKKKYVLICSSLSSSTMLAAQIFVIYFEVNQKVWPYTSLVVLLLFIVFYCVGIGNIPVTYIPLWFPKEYKIGLSKLFQMEFFMFAVIATKIFQVWITAYSLYVGFCMFLAVDLTYLIFIIFFIEKNPETPEKNAQSNKVYFRNNIIIQSEKSTK